MEGLRPLLSMSEGGTKAETDRILSALPLHQRDRYMKVLVVLREKYFRHPSRNGTEVREQGVDCPTSRHSESIDNTCPRSCPAPRNSQSLGHQSWTPSSADLYSNSLLLSSDRPSSTPLLGHTTPLPDPTTNHFKHALGDPGASPHSNQDGNDLESLLQECAGGHDEMENESAVESDDDRYLEPWMIEETDSCKPSPTTSLNHFCTSPSDGIVVNEQQITNQTTLTNSISSVSHLEGEGLPRMYTAQKRLACTDQVSSRLERKPASPSIQDNPLASVGLKYNPSQVGSHKRPKLATTQVHKQVAKSEFETPKAATQTKVVEYFAHACPDGPVPKTDVITEKSHTSNLTVTQKTNTRSESLPAASGTLTKEPFSAITNVASLSLTQLDKLQQRLISAPEVCFTLVFSDGSSQLRDATGKKRKYDQSGSSISRAISMTIGYPQDGDKAAAGNKSSAAWDGAKNRHAHLRYISFPLEKRSSDASHVFTWTRQLISQLMMTESRKICFDAQELVITLLETFNFNFKLVSAWLILDPKIACWMLNSDHPTEKFTHAVTLLKKHGFTMRSGPLLGIGKKQALCEDLSLLGPVMLKAHQLLQDKGLWNLFFNVEMKLTPILAGMESQGICVNVAKLTDFSRLLQEEIKVVEGLAHESIGHTFAINSVSQLRRVLYDELKLDQKCSKRLARTQAGNMKSTAEKVLQQLCEFHPLPGYILEHRHLAKVKSTYIDGLLPHVEKGVIHSCWLQDGTATGRLASVNPNIQNVPKSELKLQRSGSGNMCIHPRDVFVSSPGWTFLSADFQSIELRLLAHLSNDSVLLNAFNRAERSDIFMMLTSEWLGVPADSVSTQDREKTKRLVYSVVYGVGSERMSEVLGTSIAEAKDYMDSFLKKFPSLQQFTQHVVRQSRQHGCCRSMFGRMRIIQDIQAATAGNRLHAERQSGNFVIQGSAADLCKIAMIKLVKEINQRPDMHGRLLLQIHDELLLEVPDDELDVTQELMKHVLEDTVTLCEGFPVKLQVDLPVSMHTGKTWGSMQTLSRMEGS